MIAHFIREDNYQFVPSTQIVYIWEAPSEVNSIAL
jgi:hypothetical protein